MNAPLELVLAPLRLDDSTLAARIGEGLLALGYTGDAMREAVPESAEASTAMKMDYAGIAERLSTETALACLLRAFLLRIATPEELMRHRVGAEFFELCDEAGLWSRVEGGVVGSAVFLEDEKLFLLSDHTTRRTSEIAMHWVMSIGTSTVVVADSIDRTRYARVLDLCCGSGIQAFYVAPFADRIVAIDRNPRALNYGRFAAGMNGFPHIEFRESDCYAAVEGEKFDLIVCNPPYVMTPDRQSYYRDGGMGGDRFSERVLREAPAYMSEGGFTHMTCDVGAMNGKSSEERLREWLAGNGCDVVALAGKRMSAGEYIQAWLKLEEGPEAEAEAARWGSYFQELGVPEIQNWLVVMRRRTGCGPNWFHVEALPAKVNGYFGHQVGRMFRCQDLLRRGEKAIWGAKLRIARDVRLERVMRPSKGMWAPESARITFAEGLIQDYEVDPGTAGMLLHFEQEKTAEMALRRIAAEMKSGPEDVRSHLLDFLENLIAGGVLEPA